MASQLRERFEKERAIEKGKSEFITNISHDLRTPLTSIIGYLALINENNIEIKRIRNVYSKYV